MAFEMTAHSATAGSSPYTEAVIEPYETQKLLFSRDTGWPSDWLTSDMAMVFSEPALEDTADQKLRSVRFGLGCRGVGGFWQSTFYLEKKKKKRLAFAKSK